ncbi:DNA-binding protein [Sphingomonas crocodyli]|uniref:DNA-binding protein n=2 Tax=Sphingomonas crocodyli TaxID=1979270 RepID=A0A437MBN8_9SPHN|nr:DNA-binding protein [Sphingomonas crocodyli]
MSINDFRAYAKVGRTLVYKELAKGTLEAVKVGRRTLILTSSARTWVEKLDRYGVR